MSRKSVELVGGPRDGQIFSVTDDLVTIEFGHENPLRDGYYRYTIRQSVDTRLLAGSVLCGVEAFVGTFDGSPLDEDRIRSVARRRATITEPFEGDFVDDFKQWFSRKVWEKTGRIWSCQLGRFLMHLELHVTTDPIKTMAKEEADAFSRTMAQLRDVASLPFSKLKDRGN